MTKIEYAEISWNPYLGCEKISPGCKNCYAIQTGKRLISFGVYDYDYVICGNDWNGETIFRKTQIDKPSRYTRKKRIIFVCTMGDIFYEKIPFEWTNSVFSVMSDNDNHIYLVLTKRPKRMQEFFKWKSKQHGIEWIPKPNIWFGVTVENSEYEWRIDELMKVPEIVRFISAEPLLSHIEIMDRLVTNQIHWVVAGPETGPKKRPMERKWLKSIFDQCFCTGIPFFDKKNILQEVGNQKYPELCS